MFGLGLTSGAAILLLIVLLNAAGVGTPPGAAESSWLFTGVVALAGRPSLAVALGAFVGITAFQGWLSWRQSKLVVGLTQDVMLAMRQQVFTAICHAPWTVFCRHRSSDLLESLVAKIDRIGQALAQNPGRVLVSGHTDNVPIRSARFPSNWHLSQARAQAVQQILAEKIGAARIQSEGRADSEPIASNVTVGGRARNRRVEVSLFAGAQ